MPWHYSGRARDMSGWTVRLNECGHKPDWRKGKKTVFEGANIGADDGLAKGVDEAPVRLSNEKEGMMLQGRHT